MKKSEVPIGDRDPRGAGELLPNRLSKLAQLLSSRIEEPLRLEHGLPMKDWKVMQALAAQGAVRPIEIQQWSGQNKAQISRALKCLLDRALVAKHPHPEDARTFVVSLTEEGRAMYREIVTQMRRRQADVLGDLTPEDAEVFGRLLDRLEQTVTP